MQGLTSSNARAVICRALSLSLAALGTAMVQAGPAGAADPPGGLEQLGQRFVLVREPSAPTATFKLLDRQTQRTATVAYPAQIKAAILGQPMRLPRAALGGVGIGEVDLAQLSRIGIRVGVRTTDSVFGKRSFQLVDAKGWRKQDDGVYVRIARLNGAARIVTLDCRDERRQDRVGRVLVSDKVRIRDRLAHHLHWVANLFEGKTIQRRLREPSKHLYSEGAH